MCGILGVVDTGWQDGEALRRALRRMGRWQFHRGPDEWGEWIEEGVGLGHNRLSIIDLECGHQPMASADGKIQVVFNGAIYNYRDLWRELQGRGHEFRTDHSDTEVIVHGYAEWGTGVFERLEGMFAIGLWDGRSRLLLLARDRLGVKPLFYAEPARGGLVFASEPKTILASGLVPRALRAESLVDYFVFRAPRHPHTLIQAIRKLPAGTWCRYRPGTGLAEPVQFWSPRPAPPPVRSVHEAEELVVRELERAVAARTIADVPVGVFLSGGIDSSLVAAMVSRHQRLDAFTIGSPGPLDETPYARTVAERFGMRLHARRVDGRDFVERFDDWAYFNDDPVSDPSALALMVLAKYARESGMKVMLAGEGADETFGGYNAYLRYALFWRLSRIPGSGAVGRRLGRGVASRNGDYLRSLGALRFLGAAHVTDAMTRRRLFLPELGGVLDDLGRNGFAPPFRDAGPLREAMLFDQLVRLPDDLLARTDRATMAVSLETRVPFMDHHLVELANSLPDAWCVKLGRFTGKWLLKRILARLVPRQVVYRPKRGFDLPLGEWLRADFAELVRHYLRDRAVPGLDYAFLAGAYGELCDRGPRHEALIWAWLVVEKWYRMWIRGEAEPPEPPIQGSAEALARLREAVATR